MSISPAMIKELREKTGAGMMDCKKALTENNGDMDAAIDWLRTKGLAQAAKKSGRIAAEGLVAFASAPGKGALIELNSETDFVARNDQFQALAENIAKAALDAGSDVEKLKTLTIGSETVEATITNAIATIGEHMNLRRTAALSVKDGVVACYIHSAVKPGMGKIGVLVALESEGDKAALETLGKQIAMHVAAARPDALTADQIDPANLERERAVFKEQAMASGKPADIAEKMVEGRVRKYYEEVVLLEQVFVIDGKTKVKDVVEATAKDIGKPVQLVAFERFALGEGIEKREEDFAAEVAKAAGAA